MLSCLHSVFVVNIWTLVRVAYLILVLVIPLRGRESLVEGIDHFCIHAGGRAVIEGVQKNLNLRDDQVAPSVSTLHQWGNTSSSSIWYEADWIERFSGQMA